MSDPTRESLQRAYDLFKAGRRTETLQILQQVLMADDANVNAWWLMANVVENPADRRVALANVLELNPEHSKAQAMLAELVGSFPRLAQKPDLVMPPAGAAPRRPGSARAGWVVTAVVVAITVLLILLALMPGFMR
ncbi:MAG: hypothetical protein JXB47_16395 [Anaerolineae bacterium]|nr:hypothetical protein [Anaerolineae bacterium]